MTKPPVCGRGLFVVTKSRFARGKQNMTSRRHKWEFFEEVKEAGLITTL
jgi:hypothetical protein